MQGGSSSCGKTLAGFVFIQVLIFTTSTSMAIAVSTKTDHHLDHSEHYSNETSSSVASAIFVFGDSTVDPGNNNNIKTTAKANFPPYGRDLVPNHMPTGRFCNGKLVTDFIASYLGIKELVPPYLDTTLTFQELISGVSFASASTGFDPVTAKIAQIPRKVYHNINRADTLLPGTCCIESHERCLAGGKIKIEVIGCYLVSGREGYIGNTNILPCLIEVGFNNYCEDLNLDLPSGITFRGHGVIPIQKQLDHFKEYKAKLQRVVGKKQIEDHIQKAIFVISAGTNDFILNYFGVKIQSKAFTVGDYQIFLIKKTQEFLQGLWDLGARRIMVVGLPPIGCLPILITLKSDDSINILKRKCVDKYSTVANDYNTKLQQGLVSIQQSFAKNGGLIAYVEIYRPLQDMIDNPNKFGFEDGKIGCCATGLFELAFLCNPTSFTCSDASKYIFWDSVHPTEKTYYILFTNVFRNIVDLILAHQ